MSAFSPQLCPDKETLSFNHVLSVPLPSPSAPPPPPEGGRGGRGRERGPLWGLDGGQDLGILLRPDTLSVPPSNRPLSYYAFINGWLLPSPPNGCVIEGTTFISLSSN